MLAHFFTLLILIVRTGSGPMKTGRVRETFVTQTKENYLFFKQNLTKVNSMLQPNCIITELNVLTVRLLSVTRMSVSHLLAAAAVFAVLNLLTLSTAESEKQGK